MRSRRFIVAGMSVILLLGLSAAWAQRPGTKARPLDPDVLSVRILLGVGDTKTESWNGRMALDHGEIVGLEGWRFREGDLVTGPDSWKAQSRLIRTGQAARAEAKKATGPGTSGPSVTPNGVIASLKAPLDSTLTIETDQGRFEVKLSDLEDGSLRRYLNGRVSAQRVAPSVPLVEDSTEDDFPSAASDASGALWVAYVAHTHRGSEVSEGMTERPKSFKYLVPEGGGDQVRLLRFSGGIAQDSVAVTGEGLDVWRPAVAIDGKGNVVVAWSENRNGNWELFSRTYNPSSKSWTEPRQLTDTPLNDTHLVLASAPDGRVWMAWQGWKDGQADIWLAPVDDPSSPINVSHTPANEWAPALAIDRGGRIHVAYDSYQAGNYDVMLRTLGVDGGLGKPVAVANSSRFEVRPSLAIDNRGRVWVAYEERTDDWGKDAENLVSGEGSSLYRESAVKVRCVEGERVLEAPDPVAGAPQGSGLRQLNSFPRLASDPSGRIWLLFRHRDEAIWGNNAVMVVGGVWLEYATSLAGKAWETPLLLPRSDGLLDNRPAVVPMTDGKVLAVYNSDRRLRHEVEFTPDLRRRFYTHSGTPAGVVNNDLEIAALLPLTKGAIDPALSVPPPPEINPPVHPNEAADVERMRTHRIHAGGKTYQLLRGEFHRHSEISQDGGSDGALEDMWRYAIDAAHFDWIGNGDHDAGGGKEYTWWLIQKTTDLYHSAPTFNPMFTYERSVSYPHGHRNVMFTYRGVRTLPRLIDERGVSDDDTKMLYAYLRELDGICASHSSGTGMGTDWRDNDRNVEPFVEIFQGHRNSYEHLGAPRVARRASEAIGGWKPLGMVWNALAMQYRLGYQASSDHISTHISYAIAIAEEPTRAAIFDAFKNRHCYAATDNILLDVRCGEHLMGDEFNADGPVRLKILAHGTKPIARVDIIKDFVYMYSTEPHNERVQFEWTDEERRPAGLSWYYVRVLQEDGEIAWGSPFWVHTQQGTNVE